MSRLVRPRTLANRTSLVAALLTLACTRSPAVDADSFTSGNTGSDNATTTTRVDTSGSSASTGVPGALACDGGVPRGGYRAPMPGTGVEVDVIGANVEITDVGSTLGILATLTTDAVVATVRTLVEPPVEVPDLYVFGPVFEFTPTTAVAVLNLEAIAVPDELRGDCNLGVFGLDEPAGWIETDVLLPGPARFVIASRCDALTCDGVCDPGIDEEHCGSCDLACGDAVCFADACAGSTIEVGGDNLVSDGTAVWWRAGQELHALRPGEQIEAQSFGEMVALWDVEGRDGRVLSIESGVETSAVRSRAVGMPPEDVATFPAASLSPLAVAFDGDRVALYAAEGAEPLVLVQDWSALDEPWTELTECIAGLPIGLVDLGIAAGDLYYVLDAGVAGLVVQRCEPTAGGGVVPLQLPDLAPKFNVRTAKFLVADGDIWVSLNGNILRGPLGADALELVATTAANALAVADGVAFAASEDGTALVRIDDGVTTELLADEVVVQLAIHDDTLYWTSQLDPERSPNFVVRSRLLAELGG